MRVLRQRNSWTLWYTIFSGVGSLLGRGFLDARCTRARPLFLLLLISEGDLLLWRLLNSHCSGFSRRKRPDNPVDKPSTTFLIFFVLLLLAVSLQMFHPRRVGSNEMHHSVGIDGIAEPHHDGPTEVIECVKLGSHHPIVPKSLNKVLSEAVVQLALELDLECIDVV